MTPISRMFAFLGLVLCIFISPVQTVFASPEPEIVIVPVRIANSDWNVHVQLFKPEGTGPFPLLVFSHGRAAKSEDRANLKYPVLRGHVDFWLRQGFAVLVPFRPGYGETGGTDIETGGIHISQNGECTGNPTYNQAAERAADTIAATVRWAQKQAWVKADTIVLAGQSVGGMATVAAGARNLRGVIGYINFSGGDGGDPERTAGKSCFPEALTSLYASYGRTTKVPNLWLYAENDLFWGPDMPPRWHQAFVRSGGNGQFVETGPVPNADGHKLLANGGRLWADHLEPFMKILLNTSK